MTFVLALVVIAVILFATEKLPVDLVALLVSDALIAGVGPWGRWLCSRRFFC